MALARLAMKKVEERVANSSSSRRFGNELLRRRFASSSATASEKSEGNEIAVSSSGGRRSRQMILLGWLLEFFPSGLGNALMQASENINRLFDNMNLTPWSLTGRVRERDDHYKLRYDMPGVAKEDVKITIDDGVLKIKGEHKEEKEEEDDDEYWSSSSYGYYDTNLVLPDDAKADEIKAELKDGVLTITIPRTQQQKKDVKQISVH
ncbi:26.5 kDa heat shock protein, mitochondrial [Arachis duranensis]|uniref:26.5 kDa heat shock protein, mitochondrial n=1 Tax=Arachis duranensis TaxID=130453 RepID=A0A9C6TRH0_ARADU|nr:26.5 kDa heat shock protein, mitochondrial [Arachis duranensis]